MAGFPSSFGDYRKGSPALGGGVSLSYLSGLPDPGTLADPRLAVVFKGLLKRDSKTRERALADMEAIVGEVYVDEALHWAWVLAYPKLSIDLSAEVRTLAHRIQGTLASRLGKQTAKHLKEQVGPWLAGQHDVDRTVAVAARQSLESVFNSEGKRKTLLSSFAASIAEFAYTAIAVETPDTLSDRNVSMSESEQKYNRVARAAVELLAQLVDERAAEWDTLEQSLTSKKLWKLVASEDGPLVRSILGLAGAVAAKRPDWLPSILPDAAKNIVYRGLRHAPPSLRVEVVKTLITLTQSAPDAWDIAAAESKKKPIWQVLADFVAKGSARADTFWVLVLGLLSKLPDTVSPYHDQQRYEAFAAAVQTGIDVEQAKSSKEAGWGMFMAMAAGTKDAQNHVGALRTFAHSYFVQDSSSSGRAVRGYGQRDKWNQEMVLGWRRLWQTGNIASAMVDAFDAMAGDEAKYDVLKYAEAIVSLAELAQSRDKDSSVTTKVLKPVVEHITARDGFSSVALSVLGVAFKHAGKDLVASLDIRGFSGQLAGALTQDSAAGVFALASSLLSDDSELQEFYNHAAKTAVDDEGILAALLQSADDVRGRVSPLAALDGCSLPKDLVVPAILSRGVFISDDKAKALAARLSETGDHLSVLESLLAIAAKDAAFVREFAYATGDGRQLVSELWSSAVTEDSDVPSELLSRLQVQFQDAEIDAIRSQLGDNDDIDQVPALVHRTESLISVGGDRAKVVSSILLGIDWASVVSSALDVRISQKAIVSNPLGGAVLLLGDDGSRTSLPLNALATATYAASLLTQLEAVSLLGGEVFSLLSFLVLISESANVYAQFAEDDVELPYLRDTAAALSTDVASLVKAAAASSSVELTLDSVTSGQGSALAEALGSLWTKASSLNTSGYYHGAALAKVLDCAFGSFAKSLASDAAAQLRKLYQQNLFGSLALISSLQHNDRWNLDQTSQFRNHVAAELIGVKSSALVEKTNSRALQNLVALNICIDSDTATESLFPPARLSMLLRSLSDVVTSDTAASQEFAGARIEILKFIEALVRMAPGAAQDSADTFVALVAESIVHDDPGVRYFSLALFETLQTAASEAVTSQEADIWPEVFEALRDGGSSPTDDTFDTAFSAKLGKVLARAPIKYVGEEERQILFGVLGSARPAWQLVAFRVLHNVVPALQEENSIELELRATKLDQDEAEPSLSVLDPALVQTLDSDDATSLGYFLSWAIAYDYFPQASFNLRTHIVGQLRESSRLDRLLDQIATVIVATPAASLPTFESLNAVEGILYDDNRKHLLQFHLLYLALLYTGSQAKSWFLGLKKRNVSIAVENYVRTVISPHIVDAELDRIQTSLASADDPENALKVRFSRSNREVRASYLVDQQSLDIVVKVPEAYPLRDTLVEGAQRVGVKEKQWRAWLLASQAVATSQNGTIRDALDLFKRNASLHFSGVEECAICYSILHEDRSLPTKVCGTCKNKFHADCLYKWFKSAGNSTCPLCRSTFTFRRGFT